MENEQNQVQTRKRRWRREPAVMGDGQKYVNYLIDTPIGRIWSGIAVLATIGGYVFHQNGLQGFGLGMFLGVMGLGITAEVYDRKNKKRADTGHGTEG